MPAKAGIQEGLPGCCISPGFNADRNHLMGCHSRLGGNVSYQPLDSGLRRNDGEGDSGLRWNDDKGLAHPGIACPDAPAAWRGLACRRQAQHFQEETNKNGLATWSITNRIKHGQILAI